MRKYKKISLDLFEENSFALFTQTFKFGGTLEPDDVTLLNMSLDIPKDLKIISLDGVKCKVEDKTDEESLQMLRLSNPILNLQTNKFSACVHNISDRNISEKEVTIFCSAIKV